MRTPPLRANFIHARGCKPFCEKLLTLPNDLTISANLGKTNIGISGSLKNGDTSKSLSAKFNMSKMRAGVEGATTQWDGNMSVTEYRELGVNTTGVVVVAVAFIAKVLGPKTAIA